VGGCAADGTHSLTHPTYLTHATYPTYLTHATYPTYLTHATYPTYLTHQNIPVSAVTPKATATPATTSTA
jgi:hypothetical protein